MTKLRAIDVCCGAGGWAVAARGLPIEIVAAFDREEDCVETYAENHPGVECVKCDVMTYDFGRFAGAVDLVLGGIPCADFSSARRGVPLSAEKETTIRALIERCIAIPGELGARWWCFEDVRDVLRFAPALEMTPHVLIESASYSPQRRLRAFLGNVPKPAPGDNDEVFGDCIRRGPYRRSLRLKGREPRRGDVYNSNCFYPWYPDEKSPTVIGLNSRHDSYAAAAYGDTWRQLEWQELATLQGFPDDYLFIGTPTRVMQQVSQAVQISTAHAILAALCAEVFKGEVPA